MWRRVVLRAARGAGRAMVRVVVRGRATGVGFTARGAAVGAGAAGVLETGAGIAGTDVSGAEAAGAWGTGSGRGPCEAGAGSGLWALPVAGARTNMATTHNHGTQRPAYLYLRSGFKHPRSAWLTGDGTLASRAPAVNGNRIMA